MATKFNMKDYLSSRREEVIAKYNKLTGEQFFSGISLKDFMLQVMHMMEMNAKSEKTADNKFGFILGQVYVNNSSLSFRSAKDDALRNQYKGTAYMAMV